jgi:hypothetical protein
MLSDGLLIVSLNVKNYEELGVRFDVSSIFRSLFNLYCKLYVDQAGKESLRFRDNILYSIENGRRRVGYRLLFFMSIFELSE